MKACELTWAGQCRYEKVEIYDQSEKLGLLLLGFGVERRHGLLRSRVIAINESTRSEFDEVTIEFNGFYGDVRPNFTRVFESLLNRLMQSQDWDELRFSGLALANADSAKEVAERFGLRTRAYRCRPGYSVDLCKIRDQFSSDYLAALSSNTRQQLRRSLRLLENEYGAARLERAKDKVEALNWLHCIAPLHRERWPSVSVPRGFDNPDFVRFHENLISSAFSSGSIDLLKLSAGDQPIAYLYNLKHKGHVGFYLSGIDYRTAERFRPGMLVHWLAIERYLSEGAEVYDFLAGQNIYKERMSTDQYLMTDLIFWRSSPILMVENFIRRCKASLRRLSSIKK